MALILQALKLFGGPEMVWSLNGFWLGSAPFCLSRLLALVLGSFATGLECLGLQNLEAVGTKPETQATDADRYAHN